MTRCLTMFSRLLLVLALAAFSPSCRALGGGSGPKWSPGDVAELVSTYRADVRDIAPLASPNTQEKLAKLDEVAGKVEDALRALAAGGPIEDLQDVAHAAAIVAEQVIAELEASGRDVRDLRFAVAVVKIALRHMEVGDVAAAGEALEEGQETGPSQ